MAAREGGALPDLTLHRDDERKVVARWAPDGGGSDHPSLCFTGEGERHLEIADAERGLAEAVEAVLDRLEGFEEPEVSAFRKDWAAITGATEQERNLCEWSARLGIDPFDPEELTDELAETLPELLAGLEAPLRDDLLDAERPQTLHGDVEWLRGTESLAADAGSARHREFDPPPPTEAASAASNMHAHTAHGLGYACAATVRRHLSPADGHEPFGDLDEILVRLGWARDPFRKAPRAEGPLEAALERSGNGAPVAVVSDTDHTGNRFKLARAIFLRHFGRDRTGRRLVTEAHTREQRASRAFAAEFLAPAAGLSRHVGERVSRSEIEHLAHHYDVNPFAIGHQIQNHRLAWIGDS